MGFGAVEDRRGGNGAEFRKWVFWGQFTECARRISGRRNKKNGAIQRRICLLDWPRASRRARAVAERNWLGRIKERKVVERIYWAGIYYFPSVA